MPLGSAVFAYFPPENSAPSATLAPGKSSASYMVGAAKADTIENADSAASNLHPIQHSLIYALNIPSNGRDFHFASKKAEKTLSFPQ
jgi:hypothetical protein